MTNLTPVEAITKWIDRIGSMNALDQAQMQDQIDDICICALELAKVYAELRAHEAKSDDWLKSNLFWHSKLATLKAQVDVAETALYEALKQ